MLFKLLLLCFAVVSAMDYKSSGIRRVRSPEPSGWQNNNGHGSSTIGLTRNGGGWGNNDISRSAGWGSGGGSGGYGGFGGSRGYSAFGLNGKSGCASSSGWTDSTNGFRSNGGSHVY